MPPTASNEEIIEKKPSAPVATACLIIAALALLGAVLLQLIELGEYRTGIAATDKDPAATKVNAALKKLKEEVTTVLEKTAGAATGEGEAVPADTKAGGAEAAGDAGAGAAETKADESAEAAPETAAEPAPAEAADEKAEPATDEKAEEK